MLKAVRRNASRFRRMVTIGLAYRLTASALRPMTQLLVPVILGFLRPGAYASTLNVQRNQSARLGGSWASTQKIMRPVVQGWLVGLRRGGRPGYRRALGPGSRAEFPRY